MLQLVMEERCDHCVKFISNRLQLWKKGCYACPRDICSLGRHDRKRIHYHERLPGGQTSEDIVKPQTQPTIKAKEHRTVYPLGTGPKGNNPNIKDNEVSYRLPATVRCAKFRSR
jgi:hypothetical protein